MKRLLLTNKYQGLPLEILMEAIDGRFELLMLDEVSQTNLMEKIPQADYLLVSGRLLINDELLQRADNLKMVQRTGVGLDTLDLDALKRCGIPLYVNAGVNSNSVAEHAVMMILGCMKRSCAITCQVKKGIWKKQQTGLTTHELAGKTVGIVGAGKIGQRVAELLQAFRVNLIYYDQYRLSEETEKTLGLTYMPFERLLTESDVITLHCGMSKENYHLVGRKEIASMKDGAVLVNTARGGLIDYEALAEALEAGKLMGAGIDTYEEEPVPADHPILKPENALLSPHIGGVSYEAFSAMMRLAVYNIAAFDEGKLDEIENNRKV